MLDGMRKTLDKSISRGRLKPAGATKWRPTSQKGGGLASFTLAVRPDGSGGGLSTDQSVFGKRLSGARAGLARETLNFGTFGDNATGMPENKDPWALT